MSGQIRSNIEIHFLVKHAYLSSFVLGFQKCHFYVVPQLKMSKLHLKK